MLENIIVHPGLFLILIFLLYDFLPKRLLGPVTILAPVVSYFIFYFRIKYGSVDTFFHYQENVFSFTTFFLIILFSGILFAFSNDTDKNNDIKFALFYAGASISAIITNNMLAVFVFFELMLVSATFLIFNGNNKISKSIGLSYFKLHIIAGTILFIGVILHYLQYKSLSFIRYSISDFSSPKIILMHCTILLALLINIAVIPFSYWLTEGYSASSPVGSVFLSVYTTKVAIFWLAKIFIGNTILIYVGIFMGAYGVLYALLENNIRRVINFSIISQSGLILIAIGIGDSAAKDSAYIMSISGIIYTALVMMCMGAVVIATNKKRYHKINKIVYDMKFVFICSIVGFASIAALPFTAGYIGKYVLYKSNYVINNPWLKHAITAISAGIMFSVAIKLPIFTFITDFKYKDETKDSCASYALPISRIFALFVLTFVCFLIGIMPEVILQTTIDFYDILARDYFLLFLGSFVGFLILQNFMRYTNKATLIEPDWIYRYLLFRIYTFSLRAVLFVIDLLSKNIDRDSEKFKGFMTYTFGPNGKMVAFKLQKNSIVITVIVLILFFISMHNFNY